MALPHPVGDAGRSDGEAEGGASGGGRDGDAEGGGGEGGKCGKGGKAGGEGGGEGDMKREKNERTLCVPPCE